MPPQTPRILVLGFSATAQPDGYAAYLRGLLARDHPHIHLHACGLGGLHPLLIPPALDHLQATQGPFTHVLLDIATSIYGNLIARDEAEARAIAQDCLHRPAALGIRPALLVMPRRDLNADAARFTAMLAHAAQEAAAPVLDLTEPLAADPALLRDAVHTTPQGSRRATAAIAAALAPWWNDFATPPPAPRPPAFRRALPLASPRDPHALPFDHHGFACHSLALPAGQRATLRLSHPVHATGLAFVTDPRAGLMHLDGDCRPLEIQAYDTHAYYDRLNFNRLTAPRLATLRIAQDPAMPDIALRKGTPDPAPRRGRPTHLHYLAPSLDSPPPDITLETS
jgi:hypothetical protein